MSVSLLDQALRLDQRMAMAAGSGALLSTEILYPQGFEVGDGNGEARCGMAPRQRRVISPLEG